MIPASHVADLTYEMELIENFRHPSKDGRSYAVSELIIRHKMTQLIIVEAEGLGGPGHS